METLILAIETSCDETAASVYGSTRGVLSNVLFSQVELHKSFGGVVPEIASRSHLEKIGPIVKQALSQADATLEEINIIGVTAHRGLPGSLLVGLCFAKALAWASNKKIIGVDHLDGHVFSPLIEHKVPFPHLCLTASGGHTAMFLVGESGTYTMLGQTLDDAAGEAFDKVAKLIDVSYPGGPVIEQLARGVNFKDFFGYPVGKKNTLNFSFSGLKTAVLYDLIEKKAYDMQAKKFLRTHDEHFRAQVASSFLVCVGRIFCAHVAYALTQMPEIKAVTFAGGVACNEYLQQQLTRLCMQHGLPIFYPSRQYCTDNAAMIAYATAVRAERNLFDDLTLDIS